MTQGQRGLPFLRCRTLSFPTLRWFELVTPVIRHPQVIARVIASRYIADSRSSALVAASEFLAAKGAGLITDDHISAEIGEVLLGRTPGRTCTTEITFYKSLGHIVQDLAAIKYVHDRAGTYRSSLKTNIAESTSEHSRRSSGSRFMAEG
jgi:hypothetical protein